MPTIMPMIDAFQPMKSKQIIQYSRSPSLVDYKDPLDVHLEAWRASDNTLSKLWGPQRSPPLTAHSLFLALRTVVL